MKLNPMYVSGLVDGEGSFSVSFNFRKKLSTGIETRPSFSISLNEKDLNLIKGLKEFFKCGGIRYSRRDRTYKFEVRSIQDLMKKIIPHFKKHPLRGKKGSDFETFSKICALVHANLHLNKHYLRTIIELAYTMNTSGKRKYKKEELLKVLSEVKG